MSLSPKMKWKLPNAFKDFAAEIAGDNHLRDSFFTHCHRELFHVQWEVLLDDEFIEVYHHGIVCHCHDGVDRWLYPWIFTYSADYPEKWVDTFSYLFGSWPGSLRVLIAMVQNMGECLCPRCLIPKSRVHQIATERDMLQWKLLWCCDMKERCDKVAIAWRLIYEKQYAVNTPQVEELLKCESLVPTLVEYFFP